MTYSRQPLSPSLRFWFRLFARARWTAHSLALLLVTIMAFTLSGHAVAQEGIKSEYHLHPQDRLLLRVVRWDPEQDVFVSLDGLVGEYTISTDGMLVLPLLGPIAASGQTTQSLSRALARKLDALLNLSPPPRVGVDVVGHLPVYVLGQANAPGAYPYHPGMSVEQALALAGGLIRPAQSATGLRPGTLSQLAGDIRRLTVEISHREAEKQRLLADLADLEGTADSPVQMQGGDPLNADLRTATTTARKAQQDRIRELQSVLGQQINHMSTQITLRSQQITEARAELDAIATLKERGLINNERVSTLTNALNNLTSARLQLEIARLTARQQLNRAERDGLALTDEARTRTLQRLNRLRQETESLEIRLDTLRTRHAEISAADYGLPPPGVRATTEFHVTRNGPDGPQTLALVATDLLLPGDTVRVDHHSTLPPTEEQTTQLSPALPLAHNRQVGAPPFLEQDTPGSPSQ